MLTSHFLKFIRPQDLDFWGLLGPPTQVYPLQSKGQISVSCQLGRVWNLLGDGPLGMPVGDYFDCTHWSGKNHLESEQDYSLGRASQTVQNEEKQVGY